MKKLILTLTMLLTLGFSFSSVAAQVSAPDPDSMTSSADVEGLVSAYDRTYTVDFEALMASPTAEMDTAAMMRMVSVQGMTFDSDDNAEKFIDDMKSDLDKAMSDESNDLGDMETSDDLGDIDKDGIMVTTTMEDLDTAITVIVFVDGDQVFQVTSMDSDLEASKALATDVSKAIVDAETETDEVTLNIDGTSTGGVFDRLPAAGDEVVGNLTTVTDTAIVEEGGE